MNEVKKIKVGESFTIERDSNGGVPYSYYLTKLEGGLALIDAGIRDIEPVNPGSPNKVYFTFKALFPGKATYQLAKFRVFDISDVLFENIMEIEVVEEASKKSTNSNIVGGWSPFADLTADDKKVFDEAFNGFVGVTYEPQKVSKQVVNGVNYRYMCNAKGVYPGAQTYKAIVSIYKPLKGDAFITNIQRID